MRDNPARARHTRTLHAPATRRDAATDERSGVLARYQAGEALRRARDAARTVEEGDRTRFDDEAFEAVVGPYR